MSPEICQVVGADVVGVAEGNTLDVVIVEASSVPPGSPRAQHAREGFPGTWEAPPSPSLDGTAKPRTTKRSGMDGGVSEHLIVPMKQGNRLAGPCGGKEVPICRTVGGNNA